MAHGAFDERRGAQPVKVALAEHGRRGCRDLVDALRSSSTGKERISSEHAKALIDWVPTLHWPEDAVALELLVIGNVVRTSEADEACDHARDLACSLLAVRRRVRHAKPRAREC